MRQRVTFFHAPESPVDPELLHVAETALTGPTIHAAREDRATLALDELPAELRGRLGSGVHELHVRWARPQASELVSPLLARLSPGLHVFFTPTTLGEQLNVCLLLKDMFGQSLPCETTATSFTALGTNGRFSHSAAFQYYAPLDSLSVFSEYVKTRWCASSSAACPLRVTELEHASSLDLSYDTISHALKVTALWPPANGRLYATSSPGSRTEVGVLAADTLPTLGPYELGMAGHVAVLGQDDHPSRVVFGFPSRHRYAGSGKAAFSAAFLQPTGLHPALELHIASGPPPRGGSGNDNDGHLAPQCRLHAYLTLPSHLFADKYQLSDPLFLASKNLSALHYITEPVDLEAPDYAVQLWGSAVLMELAPPPPQSKPEAVWTAHIPLHLRYLQPADGGYRSVDVPYPAVFWACAAEEGTKFATNPFDRVNLGYDGLFGPRTEFWHLDPNPRLQRGAPLSQAVLAGDRLTMPLRVPVLDASRAQWVNAGTGAVILLGLSWVLWKILAVYQKDGYGRVPASKTAPSIEKKTL